MRLSFFQRLLISIIAFFIILLIILFGLKGNPLLASYDALGYDFITTTRFYFVEKPVRTTLDFFKSYAKYESTTRELELLQGEIEKIGIYAEKIKELQRENDRLKALLNLENSAHEYDTQAANVIARNVDGWHNYLTIDLGEMDGIKVNQAVMNQDGLIGKVYQVYNSTALIKLITSEDGLNKISLKISQKEVVEAILDHYDAKEQCFIVRVLDDNTEIEIGSKVVTSTMGGVYPNGILVGSVERVEAADYILGKIVYVKPAADFRDINVVMVVERSIEEVNE